MCLGAGSTALGQVRPDAASPPLVGSVPPTPRIQGAAGASDWLPGSPAAADSAAADSIAARSADADSAKAALHRSRRSGATAGDTLRPAAVIAIEGDQSAGSASGSDASAPGRTTTIQLSVPGSAAGSGTRSSASLPRSSAAVDHFLRLPPNTATGVSIGYPAYPGLFVVAPADGPLAFRSGFTGFPTIGLLWTPGLEYRFGQKSGTLSQDGVYTFGNAFLGRTYLDGDQHGYTGAEAGLGFRWLINDRRGVRWIAALEAGGYWRGDPVRPKRPCLRFLWALVE